jgi:hypothetical protein
MYAVYAAPREVILTAKVRPSPGLTGEQLAQALDEIDHVLRGELPEIAEVFIDVTGHLRLSESEQIPAL